MEELPSPSPALRRLPEDARRALSDAAREVVFRKGQRLIPLGHPPQSLFILTDGLAKLVGVSPNGHERILHVHRPDDQVGPTVLLDRPRGDDEVVAMSPARALAVSRLDLLMIGRRHPAVIVALAQEVSRLLEIMTRRMLVATSLEIPVRLSVLLLDFSPGSREGLPARPAADGFVPLTHPLTHEVMSQIVGASRPHTSTVLRHLEELGAVRRSRKGLLVQPARLARIVDTGDTGAVTPANGSVAALS